MTIRFARWGALVLAATLCTTVSAQETITYIRDALGQLVKVARAGTVNNGATACYSFDRAGNRNNVTVSTTSDCASTSPVSFSVNDVSVKEGGALVFTVTKTGTASGTLTVDYGTSDGSATSNADYTPASGTLTFLTTDTSKPVSVQTIDDTIVENPETLLLNLSNASAGSAISDGQGIGTINDNDTDCVGVTYTIASNGAVIEGANSVFTVTKSGSTSNSCSISYATASGTALSGSDFTATSGTLTFTSAQTTQTVSVPTIDDSIAENPETFGMSLSNPDKSGALGSPSVATATINDNDTCAGISFTVASSGPVTEGAGSVFTVTKTGSTGFTCTVNYATSDGTAVAPGDYTATSGTLTFNSTTTSVSVTVPTVDDSIVESPETFSMSLNLTGITSGQTLGTPGSATATINDNDGGGPCSGISYAVSDASNYEGSPLVFTVTKAGSTSSSCTVNYATADGTATAPTYYTAKSGTLTFASMQTSQTVSVTTIDRSRAKGTLTMYLNLTTASGGAGFSDSQGAGSIAANGGTTCKTCIMTNGTSTPGASTSAPDSSGSDTSTPPPP